jgi:hypothetical protein
MRISPKNRKLGNIPNVSTIPVKDCGKNAIHCGTPDKNGKIPCYAMKAWQQYPNVRKAWKTNSQQFRKDPDSAFSELSAYIAKRKPRFFRIHVSGDFLDQDNADRFISLASEFAYPRDYLKHGCRMAPKSEFRIMLFIARDFARIAECVGPFLTLTAMSFLISTKVKTMDTFQNLNPGDSVRFRYRDTEKTAPVLRMLTFPDHVVVKFGPCGHVVDSNNFIRVVRRKR